MAGEKPKDGNDAILQMRMETSKLIARMKDGPRGAVITDEDLRAVCGADCRPGESGYGFLATAKRRVLRDYGLHWERIPGAGCIRCLLSGETLDSVRKDREAIGRRSRRGLRKLKVVQPESDAERVELNASIAQLGTLAAFSTGGTLKALQARNMSTAIDVPKLLEAMRA